MHSDRGSQGGFNWSTQRLDQEVVARWPTASKALPRLLKRCAAIGKSQETAVREMDAVSSTAFSYGDHLVQLLSDDIELFRLAQAAVNTWRPGAHQLIFAAAGATWSA